MIGGYSEDTSVLTATRGWIKIHELKCNDSIYSKDSKGKLVSSVLVDINSKRYNGMVLSFKSTNIDLLVHRDQLLWVFDYNKRSDRSRVWKFLQGSFLKNGRYTFDRASLFHGEYMSSIVIPEVVYGDGKDNYESRKVKEFDALLFMKFLGVWITDGSLSPTYKGSGRRLEISQTKVRSRRVILSLLKSLNMHINIQGPSIRINDVALWEFLYRNFIFNGNFTKSLCITLPRWILNLHTDLLNALLEGILLGDGFEDSTRKLVYSSSPNFCNALTELCLKINKGASIRKYREDGHLRKWGDGRISICKDAYVVNVGKRNMFLLDRRAAIIGALVKYTGKKLYRVSLEKNGLIFVMRNGKACWSGC